MTNESLLGKCCIDGIDMLIDNIKYGHVYLICPKCGWTMSVKHSLFPDIDAKLKPTKRYADELMRDILGN